MKSIRTLVGLVVVAMLGAGMAACVPNPAGPIVGAQCTSPPSLVPGASLFGCNLAGLNLSGLDLTGTNLAGANLSNADLTGATLRNVNLEGANLSGANLTGADLTGAILAGAILLGAVFVNALLGGTSFDFGRAFGPAGLGGGTPSPAACIGIYCPGFNQATIDTGDPLCDANLATYTAGEFFVHRSVAELASLGKRSVVTDAATNFHGATFDYSASELPVALLRGVSWRFADFSGTTFINGAFGCQIADGANFSSADIRSTGAGGLATHIYHMSFLNADFSNSSIVGAALSDVSFAGSAFTDARLADVAIEVPDIFTVEQNENLPYFLVNFDNTDFANAEVGVYVNPATGMNGLTLGGAGLISIRSTTWRNADLSGAVVADVLIPGGDFTGTVAPGSTWSGTFNFEGATCPDGSVGTAEVGCFS